MAHEIKLILHAAHRNINPPTKLFPHATRKPPAPLVDAYPLWGHGWAVVTVGWNGYPHTTHRSDHTTAMGFGTAVTDTAMDTDTIHVVPCMAHWLP